MGGLKARMTSRWASTERVGDVLQIDRAQMRRYRQRCVLDLVELLVAERNHYSRREQ
jgi:hypothetical protein